MHVVPLEAPPLAVVQLLLLAFKIYCVVLEGWQLPQLSVFDLPVPSGKLEELVPIDADGVGPV